MQKDKKTFNSFVLLWAGQLVSILGSGLTTFGLSVWIFTQTGKATPLALSVLFATLPHIILSPFAGMWADRYNKKWIMIIADMGSALTTCTLFYLLCTGNLTALSVYIVTFFNSVFNVFHAAALQSAVVLLVPPEKLQKANGMNQIMDALQTLAAPLIAGILYLVIGLKGIILIDFITFFAAVFTIVIIPSIFFISERQEVTEEVESCVEKDKKTVLAFIRESLEGFAFIKKRRGLLTMMIFFAVVNFFLNLSMVLLTPLVITFSNSAALGSIQMAGGIGMFLGSIFATFKKRNNKLVKRIFFAILFASINLMIMGMRDSIVLISLGRFLFLFSIPLANTSALVIWQSKAPSYLQGRLFAARQMLARSIMPLAYIVAGPLADSVFKPIMNSNSKIAAGIKFLLGDSIGVSYRIVFILSGFILFGLTLLLLSYKPLRNLEEELPNCNVSTP